MTNARTRNSVALTLRHLGCLNCGLSAWAEGDASAAIDRFKRSIVHHIALPKHAFLHRAGMPLTSLHSVCCGSLKRSALDGRGMEQVMAFALPGDLLGLDAIASGSHATNCIALEDSRVCAVSLHELENLCRATPELQRKFSRALSGTISHGQRHVMMLARMTADERIAMFLLELSARYGALGFSANQFRLPMSRTELANYLGLKLETVSRSFSQLRRAGIVGSRSREIVISDPNALRRICEQHQRGSLFVHRNGSGQIAPARLRVPAPITDQGITTET